MWMLASLFLAVQAALSRNFLFHVEPRKSKSGRTFTSFPQGILKGTWKGEITRRLPETTRETTNRRWSERLHWVDQVTLFCNNIENWTFRQSIFLESVFYLFFSSHAEDLDPEEGEGDVDSQLSGQQGGEQWWWWWTMMVMVNNDGDGEQWWWGEDCFLGVSLFLLFIPMFATRQLLLQKSCSWSKAQLIKFHRSSSFESSGRNRVPLIKFYDKKKTDKVAAKSSVADAARLSGWWWEDRLLPERWWRR